LSRLVIAPDIQRSYLPIYRSIINKTNSPNRHRITIQTQTDVMDDKGTDLEYGSSPSHGKVNEDQDIYHMRGPKVL
jgi:hypothetical protein